ncbi:ASCH domain-containing protein [Paenibacillus sp. YYML68]|uniref:ASCH domain-containing protein n=1 Tax=Paenibacillus sp. YYML68 TaxID=2909250 RepID=UPI0024921DEF|nr:ASCH domain-containing protein [Paenibacillus sp. YYML68]
MKAITIHQPWATMIALGEKRYETRGWRTKYRGPIAIHASKKDPFIILDTLQNDQEEYIRDYFRERCRYSNSYTINRLPKGAVIATAILKDCIKCIDTFTGGYELENGVYVYHPEYEYGDFAPGRYAWELTAITSLSEPIPAKGQQGLWNWNGQV